MDCGCPDGRRITDADRHGEWHRLVTEQTGITEQLTDTALRKARGMSSAAPALRTLIDVRKKTGRRT